MNPELTVADVVEINSFLFNYKIESRMGNVRQLGNILPHKAVEELAKAIHDKYVSLSRRS